MEDNNPDRQHFYIYVGLLDSDLFNADETLLIIYLIAFTHNNEIDMINTISISINSLNQKLGISKTAIYECIRLLEEKGVLIKKDHVSEDNDYLDNTYNILNYISVWDCKTLDEFKKRN